jgi:D-3-phosphoglycerate dehydrogenase
VSYEYNLTISENNILKNIKKFDGMIVRNRLKIDKQFLNKAKNIKFIGRYGSGMESIDTQTAFALNINCFNSSEGNANSVAEHALGMLICLFHNINKSASQLKSSIWERELNRGIELEGKTIGVIGYGNTGSAFVKKLENFECRILVYDKYKKEINNKKVEECSIHRIYKECNIISFHIPINQETKYFLNTKFINNMKNPFYIINTSRGDIVSNKDLIKGLKDKKILGACLDVIENENQQFSEINITKDFNYLLNCENVIITPHIAGLSKEANKKLSLVLIDKILKLK